jgi:hypothetical protein
VAQLQAAQANANQICLAPNQPGAQYQLTGPINYRINTNNQKRHLPGSGASYVNSQADAQAVLNAFHTRRADILGYNRHGFPVVRYNGVTGTNVNNEVGYPSQPTNVFIIKGSARPSIVAHTPTWSPK